MVTDSRRGRPRSEEATAAVLEATRDLLLDAGYEGLTMDGIAARAGVSKMTMYRRWPSKAAIVSDAVLVGAIDLEPVSLEDSGDLRADLHRWLTPLISTPVDTGSAALILALTAAAAGDPRTGERLYARFTGRGRMALLARLEAAVSAGEIPPNASFEPLVDALLGLLLFRLLTRSEPDSEYAKSLVAFTMAGLGG